MPSMPIGKSFGRLDFAGLRRAAARLQPQSTGNAGASDLLLIAAAGLALMSFAALAEECPPQGTDGLLPTFDAEDQCGDLSACIELAHDNKLQEANACETNFNKCLAALNASNEKAEAHNRQVEACRASMPDQTKSQSAKPSVNAPAPAPAAPSR